MICADVSRKWALRCWITFSVLLVFALFGVEQADARVVINEIMYNHPEDDPNGEYLELYNHGTQSVDLSGWQFVDGIRYTFPDGAVLEPGGYLVLCRNEIYVRNYYNLDDSVATYGNFAPQRLSNSGERLRLVDAEGAIVDQVTYGVSAPWPQEANGNGPSLELVHPGVDNNLPIYWRASSIPTPGERNSQVVDAAPPRFLNIDREPLAPQSGDEVTVAVQFDPDDELAGVTLTYTVNQGGAQNVPMMRGEGNRYTAVIPPLNNSAFVQYRVAAINMEGFTMTMPMLSTVDNYSYMVQDDPPQSGAVLINEIMYNNPLAFAGESQWVELFNPNDFAVDLSYWKFRNRDDNNVFLLPSGTNLPAGGYLLLATVADPAWQSASIAGMPFRLGRGDELRLYDPSDRLIAWVRYNNDREWPVGADGEGGSLELIDPVRPNHLPNNWVVAPFGGTPGGPNMTSVTDPNYRDYEIIINELMYQPEDEEYDDNINLEYVELYNRGDRAVDLSGWYFSTGIQFTFPQGTLLQPDSYLLVCRDVDRYPQVANRVGNYTGRLSNSGERVAITNARGVVIDFVHYDDRYPWPVWPDGHGPSLERISPWADGRNAQSWVSGNPSSPGAPNHIMLDAAPPRITDVGHTPERPFAARVEPNIPEVEINEILVEGDLWNFFRGRSEPPAQWKDLGFDDSGWETGPSGFGYGDGDDNTILQDMRGNYLTVYIRTTFTIDNLDDIDALILTVDYDDGYVAYINGQEVTRSNVSGNPPRHNTPADGNHGASVDDGPGAIDIVDLTPHLGLLREGENVIAMQGHNVSLTSSDLSLIPELFTFRFIEDEGEGVTPDPVAISCRVRHDEGVESVTLYYQRLFAPTGVGLVQGEWQSVPMTRVEGDEFDGRYQYNLTDYEFLQPNELWRYHIIAKDASGREAARPLQNEGFTRNFIFFISDPNEIETHPVVRIYAERSVLDFLTRNPGQDDEQPAIVVVDGFAHDLTHGGGIRFRGRTGPEKKDWRIRFPKGDRWDDRRAMDLNAHSRTDGLFDGESGVLEHLGFELYRMAGAPAPESQHKRVLLNNDYHGLFLEVERYDVDFVSNHSEYDVETRIYRAGVGSRASLLEREPDFDTYAQKYSQRSGRDDDIQPLIDWIEQLNDTEDPRAFLSERLDVERFVNYLAVTSLLSHFDSVEKNYFIANPPDGRFFILPDTLTYTWGDDFFRNSFPLRSDLSLLDGAEGGIFGVNRLRQRFLSVPEFRQRYFERLDELVHSIFTPELLNSLIDEYWEYIRPAVAENAQRWNAQGRLDELPARLKEYVEARRAFVLGQEEVRPSDRPEPPVPAAPEAGATLAIREVELRVNPPQNGSPTEIEWQTQRANSPFHQPIWTDHNTHDPGLSAKIAPTALTPGGEYDWRARWRLTPGGPWSDWSTPRRFSLQENLTPPNVRILAVTNLDRAVRIEWESLIAADLLRVDIFDERGRMTYSASPGENRIVIDDLNNGATYRFTLYTVNQERMNSSGVTVIAQPQAPPVTGDIIAYFRFENDLQDEAQRFTDGQLLGAAQLSSPGGKNPIPRTQAPNMASLELNGVPGAGFLFGMDSPSGLEVITQMTVESFAQVMPGGSNTPMVLVDRYDDSNASVNGVWRFGLNLSAPGSLDFFLNDGDRALGISGRLHVATLEPVYPDDGEFHHYAAVVDLTDQVLPLKVRLYVNGIEQPTSIVHEDDASTYTRFRTGSDQPVLVGARFSPTGTADVLDGRIDEVRLMSVTLSPNAFLNPPQDPVEVADWALY